MLGHGAFIYDPDFTINKFGSPKKTAKELVDMGMSHAWIRGHNKNGLWKETSNLKLAEAFRNENISVGVWGWCDGNNVSQDVKNAEDAVQRFQPDIYIADIENGESGSSWNTSKAKKFGEDVKLVLDEIPMVVSSFGYIDWHQPEIMSALDPYADYFAPQIYWFWYPNQNMLNQTPVEGLQTKNPADYARACLHHWRKAVTKPIIVTGQAYWGEHSSWTQTTAEGKLRDFLSEFDEFDTLAGFNWWNFAADKAMSRTMIDIIVDAEIGRKLGPITTPIEDKQLQPGSEVGSLTNDMVSTNGTLYWVAAEGLKFRATPENDMDDNILSELDYGVNATVLSNPAANGYVRVSVVIDGIDTDGYLFAKYLRPNENEKIERAIQEAVDEWLRFDKGAGLEYKQPYSGYINEMWTARGYPDLTGEDRDWYWSAAFISWVLENAGYESTKFDIRHSTYIHEAIQNRILERNRDFWGYRLDEAEPQVGDILCQWRGESETTYDGAETKSRFESHTDIVIAVRDRAVITLGGNVANASSKGAGVSVETKTYGRAGNGLLMGDHRLFAIMKNQHRPENEQLLHL